MAPNNKDLVITESREWVTQAALPYNKPAYRKFEDKESGDTSNSEEIASNGVEPSTSGGNEDNGLRITTRARYTYELDRFSKNAMLIIDNKSHLNIENISEKLRNTFAAFRFEVETHAQLNSDEISSVCESFFNRDFTEYGSVALVVLAKMNSTGNLEAQNSTYHESMVMRYLTDSMPPSLNGKPKIYITEKCGYYNTKYEHPHLLQRDVFKFMLPISIISGADPRHTRQSDPRPLGILCSNVTRFGDRLDWGYLMWKTIKDIELVWPFYKEISPLIRSTLRKELYLARS